MLLHKIALQGWIDNDDDGAAGAADDDHDGDGGGGDHDGEVHLVASQSREERSVGVRRKRRV